MPVLRLCSSSGCNRRVQSGRCPEHERAYRLSKNARVSRYGYGTTHWQQVRTQRHILAAGRCELGLPGCTEVPTHTHLDPALKGNHRIATVADVRACCAQCSGAVDAPRAR